ncbi:MAG: Type II secretion system protein E (GspE) [Candidatus Moranbacteria bacterium GW2011_GWE2_35_164]|nr:MAG: Type II secretion system protein E (GspE) [Candidatus Moranbacteria bacterium GW2011_GWE2_35_164]
MRIDNKQLKSFLLDSGILDEKEIEDVFELAENEKKLMGDLLLEKKLISKEELGKLYAYILGNPFVDISKETIAPEILKIIPEPIAKKYKIVAFDKSDSNLKVAMLNPDDLQTIEFIRA